jgi:sensor histidine kinase YesM
MTLNIVLSTILTIIVTFILGFSFGNYASNISLYSNEYGNTLRLLAIKENIEKNNISEASKISMQALQKQLKLISVVEQNYFLLSKKQKMELNHLIKNIHNQGNATK